MITPNDVDRPWRDPRPKVVPRRPETIFSLILGRFSTAFGPILFDFDLILTHRERNAQPTTHHPQHTTPRSTSCFSRPLDWAASPSVPSIPRPGGMRACALNPPPPLGGRSVPDQNSRTYRLQSLSRVRTLCRASPKVSPFLLRSLTFQIFSDFWFIFSCLKKPLNFGSAQNG